LKGFDGSDLMVTKHEKYVHPEIVLGNDDIYLMALDEKWAWFSIIPPEVNNTFCIIPNNLAFLG